MDKARMETAPRDSASALRISVLSLVGRLISDDQITKTRFYWLRMAKSADLITPHRNTPMPEGHVTRFHSLNVTDKLHFSNQSFATTPYSFNSFFYLKRFHRISHHNTIWIQFGTLSAQDTCSQQHDRLCGRRLSQFWPWLLAEVIMKKICQTFPDGWCSRWGKCWQTQTVRSLYES